MLCGRGRRESGDEYCVAEGAVSREGLWEELKLNRGAEAN